MSILDRYNALPRAGRWGVWALAAIVAYFGVIEPGLDWANRHASEGDRLEKTLADRRRLGEQAGGEAGAVLERSLVAYGEPKKPVAGGDPSGQLSRRVDDVARRTGVSIRRRSARPAVAIAGAEWSGQRLDRVSMEITVEGNTREFLQFLKELEASPDVTAINSLRLSKLPDGSRSISESQLLTVTLVPEVWATARGSAAASTPAAEAAE